MIQLPLLDPADVIARAPQWAEPPSKLRYLPPPRPADYIAFLQHAPGCMECDRAHDDLAGLRRGELEDEPAVPCSEGMRLLPLVDVDLAAPAIARGEHADAVRRIVARGRDLDGWGPEVHQSAGRAWTS